VILDVAAAVFGLWLQCTHELQGEKLSLGSDIERLWIAWKVLKTIKNGSTMNVAIATSSQ
jgi:hypothetical protein